MTMDHGHPVESLLLYPSEGLLVSAGRPNCNIRSVSARFGNELIRYKLN